MPETTGNCFPAQVPTINLVMHLSMRSRSWYFVPRSVSLSSLETRPSFPVINVYDSDCVALNAVTSCFVHSTLKTRSSILRCLDQSNSCQLSSPISASMFGKELSRETLALPNHFRIRTILPSIVQVLGKRFVTDSLEQLFDATGNVHPIEYEIDCNVTIS